MIIDNSLLIVERLIGILKEVKIAAKFFSAANYNEAVKILGEKEMDVVLLDIQLSGKSGIELLKFIVKNHPEVKVVIISNLVSVYYQRLCKKLGSAGFIDKSRDFDLIPEVVRSESVV